MLDLRYLGDKVKSGLGHERHELLALVAPRPFLLLGGDSADSDHSWLLEAERRLYQWINAYA